MHNLSNEYFQSEYETGSNYESNYELSPEFETMNESAYELSPEFETMNSEYETVQSELTQELMEINSEAEFGAWLSRLGKKAAGVASNFLRSPIGQQATAALGDIAKKTLPNLAGRAGGWLGGKIGGIVGQAGAGRQYGQQLGNMASQAAVGSYPDFVNFATDALTNLSQEYESGATPAVKPAIVNAAAKHYPIILKVKGTLRVRPVRSSIQSEYEYNNELSGEIINNESTFNEVTEMELASELLNVQSEAELDQFLGKLFKKAAGAVSSFAKSGVGKALGGVLKGVAKTALPIAGSALGTFIAPGIGTSIGGSLGSALGDLFELELEGLSAEDREFETARAFVRFAGNAAKRAAGNSSTPNPAAAARTAVVQAAKNYAPGILAGGRRPRSYVTVRDHRTNVPTDQTGSWYRDGNSIVIEGV